MQNVRTKRLFSKFLMMLLPLFALAAGIGLYINAEHTVQQRKSEMAARVGNLTSRVGALVNSEPAPINSARIENYLGLLLADQAIMCAEVINADKQVVAVAPHHIGCKGQEHFEKLVINLPLHSSAVLCIRISDEEITAMRLEQQSFALIALFIGLLAAAFMSWIGFHRIVGKPIAQILTAIQTGQAGGAASLIKNPTNDELGIVAAAFNQLQLQLALDTEKIQSALARFDQLYNQTPALMFSICDQGHIINVSDHWIDETGYRRQDVVGRHLSNYLNADDFNHFLQRAKNEKSSDRIRDIPIRFRYADQRTIDAQLSATCFELDGKTCYLCVMSDVSEIRSVQNSLHQLAVTDYLTKLPNRQGLFEFLTSVDNGSQLEQSQTAFFFIDLDGFKAVNDIYGHEAGDDLLKIAAHRLRNCIKATDFLARLGGDEFVIALRNIKDREDLPTIAERILASFNRPFEVLGQPVAVGASIGIANHDQQGESAEKTLRLADLAMYTSKNAGKNRYSIYPHNLENETHCLIQYQ